MKSRFVPTLDVRARLQLLSRAVEHKAIVHNTHARCDRQQFDNECVCVCMQVCVNLLRRVCDVSISFENQLKASADVFA